MSVYKSPIFVLPAGIGQDFNDVGNYVRFLSSTGSDDLKISFDGGPDEPLPVGVGVHHIGGFKRLRVSNPNSGAVTVHLAIGEGAITDSRFSLTAGAALPVRGGGGSFSDQEVVVSNVAVQLLLADTARSAAIIRAGTADLWLGPSAAVVAGAVPTVPAGASLAIGHTGAVFGIRAAAGLVQVGIYEEKV